MELLLLAIGSLLGYVLGGAIGWRALAFPAAVSLAIVATADSGDGAPEVAMAVLAGIALATATAAGSLAAR
jgi:hypothetical protein